MHEGYGFLSFTLISDLTFLVNHSTAILYRQFVNSWNFLIKCLDPISFSSRDGYLNQRLLFLKKIRQNKKMLIIFQGVNLVNNTLCKYMWIISNCNLCIIFSISFLNCLKFILVDKGPLFEHYAFSVRELWMTNLQVLWIFFNTPV